MSDGQENSMLKGTTESLISIQDFDSSQLPREKDLGTAINFTGAVGPANKLISFYKLISPTILPEHPETRLGMLKDRVNTDFSILNEVVNFEPGQPAEARDNLIDKIKNAYHDTFTDLESIVSYSTSRVTDFKSLERNAEAMMHNINDKNQKLTQDLNIMKEDAEQILVDIRTAAAEQGVSQQATYFIKFYI